MATGIPGPGTPATYAEVISLWVAPAFRGRGVASQLLAAVAGWAAAEEKHGGFGQLKLCVKPDNAVARTVYERNGFVRAEEPADEAMSDDPAMLVMVRQLRR